MPCMCGNVEERPALQFDRFGAPLELDDRPSFENKHPFIFFLIVPETGRRRMALRNDPLDANRRSLEDYMGQFFGQRKRNARKHVVGFQGLRLLFAKHIV